VWVSADIAKGRRERWVPVIADLGPIAAEIRADVGLDEYVLPAQRFRYPPFNTARKDMRLRPSSSQALRQLVMRVVKRAGIAAHVRPHDLRHAYAEHIARKTDTRRSALARPRSPWDDRHVPWPSAPGRHGGGGARSDLRRANKCSRGS
jgi:integrase